MQTANEIKQVIKGWSNQALKNVHTALPATMVSFDNSNARASVKPIGSFKTDDGRNLPYPVIHNAPVIFPSGSGGGAGITFPIKSGDGCLVVFSESQLDDFLSIGTKNSQDQRRFSLNDCMVIPGLYSSGVTSNAGDNDSTILTCGGSTLKLNSNGLTCSLADGSIFSLAGGTMNVNGNVVAGGISLTAHVHGGVASGGSTTSTPQ